MVFGVEIHRLRTAGLELQVSRALQGRERVTLTAVQMLPSTGGIL